jgi:putative chitinase
MKLSADLLARAAGLSPAAAAVWVDPLNEAAKRFALAATRNRLAMFLAQVGHESAGFSRLAENLNYSAQGLAATWPSRFAEKDAAGRYVHLANGRNKPNDKALAIARQPELIANQVYANRMGNGPAISGDGWKYRGRGLIQLTGRDLYNACGRAIGLDLTFQPHLLERQQWAALSAGWYWLERGLNPVADGGDVRCATRMINGGEHGLADRQQRFERANKALGEVMV